MQMREVILPALLALVEAKRDQWFCAIGEPALLQNAQSKLHVDPMSVGGIEASAGTLTPKHEHRRFPDLVDSAQEAASASFPARLDPVAMEIISNELHLGILIND